MPSIIRFLKIKYFDRLTSTKLPTLRKNTKLSTTPLCLKHLFLWKVWFILKKHPTTTTMSPLYCFHLIFFILFLSSLASAHDSSLTAYEVLEEYDFPIGLLPNGVLGYELNTTTGKFSAYLNGSCTFSIDSYKLKYSSTITGVISTDKLKSLSGIKVKVWWFWFSIVEVTRDGDELKFSVGIASADFPVTNFDECPTCGCGFDCDSSTKKETRMRVKPLVSSS